MTATVSPSDDKREAAVVHDLVVEKAELRFDPRAGG